MLYTIYLTNRLKDKKKGSKEIHTVLQSRKKGYFLILFHLPFDDMTYKMNKEKVKVDESSKMT